MHESTDGRSTSGRTGKPGAKGELAAPFFADKLKCPTEAMIAEALGRKVVLWQTVRERVAAEFGPLIEEWTYAGKNYGWSLRLKQKQRAVLYLTPCAGYFRAAFALGEKAVRAAHESGAFPTGILQVIDQAPRYAEGRAIRLEIRARKDLAAIEMIAAVKMAN
jgi:hypothetical protein